MQSGLATPTPNKTTQAHVSDNTEQGIHKKHTQVHTAREKIRLGV